MEATIFDHLAAQGIALRPQQRQAVEALEGPVLLLAVPGAGKTTVMVSRIANLIHWHGVDPGSILTITFSKAGAQDMARRYGRLFSPLGGETPAFSTIHAFCYRVLGSYCRYSGGRLPQLLEPRERTAMLRELYQVHNRELLTEDLEEELISQLSYVKNTMMTQEQIRELSTGVKNLWQLYQGYSQQKRRRERMDFDDMLGYALTVFRRYPPILESYRRRYPYLCVDEAQDTSKLQHQIIRLLAAPSNNLFLVGDEDQSIYRFRGACPENLLEFTSHYPGAQVLKMEENFRSTGCIVERAGRFIAQNRNRYQKEMFTSQDPGQPIAAPKLEDLSHQYRVVLNAWQQEKGSMAVIYRNHFSALPLADILDRSGVDFWVREHRIPLRRHYVVGDLLAFFDLSYNPGNLSAFGRVFYKTNAYLKRSLLRRLDGRALAPGESYFDRMLELEEESINSGRIRYLDSMIRRLRQLPPAKALDVILHSLGYLDFLEFALGNQFSAQAQKLGAIKNLATRVATVEEFLERMDQMEQVLASHSRPQEEGERRLTLLTAHAAKGLEFDTVVLLDLVEDVFPSHSSLERWKAGEWEELEEEARLFYVACTRARRRLILPYSTLSDNLEVTPSRFITRLTQDPPPPGSGERGLELFPGLRILHKTFGPGQVMSVDRRRGTFQAFFGPKGSRTLSLSILEGDVVQLDR